MPCKKKHAVEVILLYTASEVENDDATNNNGDSNIVKVVNHLFDRQIVPLASSLPSWSLLVSSLLMPKPIVSANYNEKEEELLLLFIDKMYDRLSKNVLRFYQCKDKYAAFLSTLLKSQAFYMAYKSKEEQEEGCSKKQEKGGEEEIMSHTENNSCCYPIVELPRTKNNKPYIPVFPKEEASKHKEEENVYPFSVSHQHPFVGIAQLIEEEVVDIDDTDNDVIMPKVGLDIVTFDDYNRRLYSSVQEFVEVFRNSFAVSEWNRIQMNDNEELLLLKEFYLRWAVKEAYTKALGVGMVGLEFNSFETIFPFDNNSKHKKNTNQHQGLWTWLLQQEGKEEARNNNNDTMIFHIEGVVVIHDEKTTKPTKDSCHFYFIPLYKHRGGDENRRTTRSNEPRMEMHGCACVCMQGLPSRPNVDVRWTTMQKLIQWHYPLYNPNNV